MRRPEWRLLRYRWRVWAIFRAVSRCLPTLRGQVTALAFAGWCSTVLASLACAGQLAGSGTVAWSVAFMAMAGIHRLIGVGEGVISVLVLLAIARTRPDLASGAVGALVVFGLALLLGRALVPAPGPSGREPAPTHGINAN